MVYLDCIFEHKHELVCLHLLQIGLDWSAGADAAKHVIPRESGSLTQNIYYGETTQYMMPFPIFTACRVCFRLLGDAPWRRWSLAWPTGIRQQYFNSRGEHALLGVNHSVR